MQHKVAVIFAGGKSSRMGRDKALLPFGAYTTLAEYQYRRLSQIFEDVYISTKYDKFTFEHNALYDIYEESSPLVGLLSLFGQVSEDELFVLSVDAPFVDSDTIERLYSATSDLSLDAIIAQSPQGKEPLCGIYRRSIVPIAKQLLDQDNHRLSTLLERSKSHSVLFSDGGIFDNLNHLHEYEEAKVKYKHLPTSSETRR